MRLIIVRHGRTSNNEQGLINHDDTPLNKEGLSQARKVAERLKKEQIDIAYTSPHTRCQETTKEILVFHPETELVLASEIREREHGIYCGKSTKELFVSRAAEQKELGTWKAPGGENDIAVRKRTKNFLSTVRKKHVGKTILLVSHTSTIAHLLLHTKELSFTLENYDAYLHKNTAVTIITFCDEPVFEILACTKHLE